jgi:hypothetical protein
MNNGDIYIDLIPKDVDAAISKHNKLSTKERVEILLYLLDNVRKLSEDNFKKFMLNSEALLLCIKEANKRIKGNDDTLIDYAVKKYNESNIFTIENLKQEVEPDKKNEDITNLFYLLINRRK